MESEHAVGTDEYDKHTAEKKIMPPVFLIEGVEDLSGKCKGRIFFLQID